MYNKLMCPKLMEWSIEMYRGTKIMAGYRIFFLEFCQVDEDEK